MPFTYLGKARVEHFAPLMNRVARQLTSISSMLTQAGKLELVNSVLSSLPTYRGILILMQEASLWWPGESAQGQRREALVL
jgi:hypothetical protein